MSQDTQLQQGTFQTGLQQKQFGPKNSFCIFCTECTSDRNHADVDQSRHGYPVKSLDCKREETEILFPGLALCGKHLKLAGVLRNKPKACSRSDMIYHHPYQLLLSSS